MPQSLAIGGAAAGVIGSGISAFSAIQQGDYQAQVAQNNAAIARGSADNAVQAGAQQQQLALLQTAGVVSAARAAGGSSGLDVNSGSGVNVRASDQVLGNLAALNIRSNAARQAYSDDIAAQGFQDSAQAAQIAGSNAAVGDIFQGLSQAGSLAGQLKASGAFQGATSPTIAGT